MRHRRPSGGAWRKRRAAVMYAARACLPVTGTAAVRMMALCLEWYLQYCSLQDRTMQEPGWCSRCCSAGCKRRKM